MCILFVFMKVTGEDWYQSQIPCCRSTGFILEGFPHNSDDVEYMVQQHIFPDLMVIMAVEAPDVQRHLMPIYLQEWHERRKWRETQLAILHDLRKKKRVSNLRVGRLIVLVTLTSSVTWPHSIMHEYPAHYSYYFSGGQHCQEKSWTESRTRH